MNICEFQFVNFWGVMKILSLNSLRFKNYRSRIHQLLISCFKNMQLWLSFTFLIKCLLWKSNSYSLVMQRILSLFASIKENASLQQATAFEGVVIAMMFEKLLPEERSQVSHELAFSSRTTRWYERGKLPQHGKDKTLLKNAVKRLF